jgi:hypothetical protein
MDSLIEHLQHISERAREGGERERDDREET